MLIGLLSLAMGAACATEPATGVARAASARHAPAPRLRAAPFGRVPLSAPAKVPPPEQGDPTAGAVRTADGSLAFLPTEDCGVDVWDVRAQIVLHHLPKPPTRPPSTSMPPEGTDLGCASTELMLAPRERLLIGQLGAWDLRAGKFLPLPLGSGHAVTPDSRYVAFFEWPRTRLVLIDLRTGKLHAFHDSEFEGISNSSPLAFDAGGSVLTVSDYSQWQLRVPSLKLIKKTPLHGRMPSAP